MIEVGTTEEDIKVSLTFAPLESTDLGWFISIRNQVRQHLHNTAEFSLEEAKDWFTHTELIYFKIFLHTQDGKSEKIGYIRMKYLDTQGLAEIGLDLDPSFVGKNLAYSSYVQFAAYLLQETDVVGVTLRVRKENLRARKLYSRLNFEILGEFAHQGFEDLLLFSSVHNLVKLPT